MLIHFLLGSLAVKHTISPSFYSCPSFCHGTDSYLLLNDLQVRIETTADLNVLHECKSKAAVEEHERHVEGKHSLFQGLLFHSFIRLSVSIPLLVGLSCLCGLFTFFGGYFVKLFCGWTLTLLCV